MVPLCPLNYDVSLPVDSTTSPAPHRHPPLPHLMNISQACRDRPPPLPFYSQTPSSSQYLSPSETIASQRRVRGISGDHEKAGTHIIWRKMEMSVHLSIIWFWVMPCSRKKRNCADFSSITAWQSEFDSADTIKQHLTCEKRRGLCCPVMEDVFKFFMQPRHRSKNTPLQVTAPNLYTY